MRIVLVAYEFPPSTSPQALRWHRLATGLAERGHEVTVLTVGQGASDRVGRLRVVRTSRGWPHALAAKLRRLLGGTPASDELPVSAAGLNWRGTCVALFTRACGFVAFPDLRGYWNASAARALEAIVAQHRPDLVVTSHEPASVLRLGALVRRLGMSWVADLGDPVDAPYTPRRWRRRAARLEKTVCRQASLVVVTSESYARDLVAKHGLPVGRLLVLRQGFDPDAAGAAPRRPFSSQRPLELVFTGQLYDFRRPEPLLEALELVDGIRFTVISPTRDEALARAMGRLGEKLRLIGALPHDEVAGWQSRADVLVNIGNRMPSQVPGKLFEYFGAGRGILHVSACDPDEAAGLVRSLRRGWVVGANATDVREALQALLARWRSGGLERGLDLSPAPVAQFSWPALVAQLEGALVTAANPNQGLHFDGAR